MKINQKLKQVALVVGSKGKTGAKTATVKTVKSKREATFSADGTYSGAWRNGSWKQVKVWDANSETNKLSLCNLTSVDAETLSIVPFTGGTKQAWLAHGSKGWRCGENVCKGSVISMGNGIGVDTESFKSMLIGAKDAIIKKIKREGEVHSAIGFAGKTFSGWLLGANEAYSVATDGTNLFRFVSQLRAASATLGKDNGVKLVLGSVTTKAKGKKVVAGDNDGEGDDD